VQVVVEDGKLVETPSLISGGHRYAAAKRRFETGEGSPTIACVYLGCTPEEAAWRTLSENVVRHDLSAAEKGELWEKMAALLETTDSAKVRNSCAVSDDVGEDEGKGEAGEAGETVDGSAPATKGGGATQAAIVSYRAALASPRQPSATSARRTPTRSSRPYSPSWPPRRKPLRRSMGSPRSTSSR
jgi:hypothetical protein